MKIETQLHKEIEDQLNELKKMKVGSEEYKLAVEGITKLMDRAIEIDKMNLDHQEKIESREIETDLKLKQMKDEKIDRIVKNMLTLAGIGVPAGLCVWGTIKSLKFEVDGTVTSIVGRGFIQKFIPKR